MSEITITGNAVEDAQLSYTPTGTAVARIRLARQERYRNGSGEWKDGAQLFITVTCWRQLAENVAASVTRGTRVVVQGKLQTRTFEDSRLVIRESGEAAQRIVTEVIADDVSVSLRNASANVTRAERSAAAQAEREDQDQAAEWPQAS